MTVQTIDLPWDGLVPRRPAWMEEAACRGKMELFFGPHGERPYERAAREAIAGRICLRCPVVEPCRQHAREHREYGYWGLESEEDRAAAGFRVAQPVGRVARYPRGNGQPVEMRERRRAAAR